MVVASEKKNYFEKFKYMAQSFFIWLCYSIDKNIHITNFKCRRIVSLQRNLDGLPFVIYQFSKSIWHFELCLVVWAKQPLDIPFYFYRSTSSSLLFLFDNNILGISTLFLFLWFIHLCHFRFNKHSTKTRKSLKFFYNRRFVDKQYMKVAWPSGLGRWFKAPVSSEAWVRIPPLPFIILVTDITLPTFYMTSVWFDLKRVVWRSQYFRQDWLRLKSLFDQMMMIVRDGVQRNLHLPKSKERRNLRTDYII